MYALQVAIRGHVRAADATGSELSALEIAIEHKAAMQLQRDEAVRQMVLAKVAYADALAQNDRMADDVDLLRLQAQGREEAAAAAAAASKSLLSLRRRSSGSVSSGGGEAGAGGGRGPAGGSSADGGGSARQLVERRRSAPRLPLEARGASEAILSRCVHPGLVRHTGLQTHMRSRASCLYLEVDVLHVASDSTTYGWPLADTTGRHNRHYHVAPGNMMTKCSIRRGSQVGMSPTQARGPSLLACVVAVLHCVRTVSTDVCTDHPGEAGRRPGRLFAPAEGPPMLSASDLQGLGSSEQVRAADTERRAAAGEDCEWETPAQAYGCQRRCRPCRSP